jgi:signal peptidase II
VKRFLIFIFLLISLLGIDIAIKDIFVNQWQWHSSCISLSLVYNFGVAFSMFEFLGEYLKYIQIVFLLAIFIYLIFDKKSFKTYYLPLSLLFAGAIGNIIDRFVYGGVVDYIYWHCGFDFAVFNFADVIIDLAVVWILLLQFIKSKGDK